MGPGRRGWGRRRRGHRKSGRCQAVARQLAGVIGRESRFLTGCCCRSCCGLVTGRGEGGWIWKCEFVLRMSFCLSVYLDCISTCLCLSAYLCRCLSGCLPPPLSLSSFLFTTAILTFCFQVRRVIERALLQPFVICLLLPPPPSFPRISLMVRIDDGRKTNSPMYFSQIHRVVG